MDKKEIEELVRKSLETILNIDNIDENESLLDIGLDSLNTVRLVVMLEEIFDITIEIEKLVEENFRTINIIVDLIKEESKQGYIRDI